MAKFANIDSFHIFVIVRFDESERTRNFGCKYVIKGGDLTEISRIYELLILNFIYPINLLNTRWSSM